MDEIELNINEFTKHFGTHWRCSSDEFVEIYLRTHYRCYKEESNLITSITKTIAHEELHIILRRFHVKYSKNEEDVFKRIQMFLYPELYNIHNKAF